MAREDRIMRLLAPVTQKIHQLCGEFFPSDYFVIDTETTGFDRTKDLITEWGHVIVRDRKVVNKINLVINWYEHPSIPEKWLTTRLNQVIRGMAHQGKTYRVTPEVMKKEGVPPDKVLPWLYDLLEQVHNDKGWIVSHNGVKFDFEMLDSHFQQDLGEPFKINPDRVIDTGCIEKASQLLATSSNARMKRGETLKDYFLRIGNWRAAGVFWNIEHCYKKYGLDTVYDGDTNNLHTAGEDAHVVHLLMEQFRLRLDARASATPPPQMSEVITGEARERRVGQRNR